MNAIQIDQTTFDFSGMLLQSIHGPRNTNLVVDCLPLRLEQLAPVTPPSCKAFLAKGYGIEQNITREAKYASD
jgi:hypothetical protein